MTGSDSRTVGLRSCKGTLRELVADEVQATVLTNQPAFYVALSRARDAAALVTDDAHKLVDRLERATGERLSLSRSGLPPAHSVSVRTAACATARPKCRVAPGSRSLANQKVTL